MKNTTIKNKTTVLYWFDYLVELISKSLESRLLLSVEVSGAFSNLKVEDVSLIENFMDQLRK